MAIHANAMVAHVWAQQNKESGRSHNGSFHFAGPVLYSYRTAIGRFIKGPNGESVTLVDSATYSKTTSGKHMPALWRAIDYGRGAFSDCFTVPNLGVFSDARNLLPPHELTATEHAENLAYLVERYSERVAQFMRKRELWQATESQVCAVLAELADKAGRYAEIFGLPAPACDAAADAARIWAAHAEKERRRNLPGAAEKRAQDRQKRAERAAKRERDRLEFQRAERAAKLAMWRAGAVVMLPHGMGTDSEGGALLRIRGHMLETGLGARVPLSDAVRVYRFVKAVKARGANWRAPPAEAIGVGNFSVTQIWPNGDFRAGCHLIRWPEIEAAALAAGVSDMEAIAPAGLIEAA